MGRRFRQRHTLPLFLLLLIIVAVQHTAHMRVTLPVRLSLTLARAAFPTASGDGKGGPQCEVPPLQGPVLPCVRLLPLRC